MRRFLARCAVCDKECAFFEVQINHPLHLILMIITLGIWLPVYLSIIIRKLIRPWKCGCCGWHKPEFRQPYTRTLRHAGNELNSVPAPLGIVEKQKTMNYEEPKHQLAIAELCKLYLRKKYEDSLLLVEAFIENVEGTDARDIGKWEQFQSPRTATVDTPMLLDQAFKAWRKP